MSKEKRFGSLTNASSILQSLLEKNHNPLSDQFLRWKLWYNWKEIVGESISKKCLPVGYNDGVLWVWVTNSAWMHHLLFLREDITHAINKKIGRHFVKYLRFTLDRHEVPDLESTEWQEMIDNSLSR
jgi:predicted nucleic acid-binding Zn ribbon protein